MNPPDEQIKKMLGDGWIGEISSIVCLSAAYAVKRGEPIEKVKIESPDPKRPLSHQEERLLLKVMREMYALLKMGTPQEVDCAIALYTAHLKAAGYSVEAGYGH